MENRMAWLRQCVCVCECVSVSESGCVVENVQTCIFVVQWHETAMTKTNSLSQLNCQHNLQVLIRKRGWLRASDKLEQRKWLLLLCKHVAVPLWVFVYFSSFCVICSVELVRCGFIFVWFPFFRLVAIRITIEEKKKNILGKLTAFIFIQTIHSSDTHEASI